MKKFKETEVVTNIERPMHHCFASTAVVSESISEDPNVSFPVRSKELRLLTAYYGVFCI